MTNQSFKILPTNIILKLCFLVVLFLSSNTTLLAQVEVENGALDLSTYDFENQSPVDLSGEWFFYWDKLLYPSDFDSTKGNTVRNFTDLWNSDPNLGSYGVATYRAFIEIAQNHPPLALDIPDFYSSYRLFLNGQEIANNGTPATSKEMYEPYWLPKTVALGEISSDTLEIIIQVANFHHRKGGAYKAISLGSVEQLISQRYLEYGYSFVLTGALVMGGLFFFGLFLFGRHETTILYFSLFCIVYSYRIIGFGTYPLHFLLQDIPWIVTLKLEYITLFLSGYLFGVYTLHLYPKEASKKLVYLISGISILFIAITLFLPAIIFTHIVSPYFIVLIFYILYAFWVYLHAAINNNAGAKFALISTGIVFFVFIYKIMVYFGIFEEFLLFNFIGYLSFFFFQSLILSYRFAEYLKKAKNQAEESSLAKSQFLSTMSHEIRTPLNAVIGLSGLLSDSHLNNKQKEYSQTIKKSGESLLSIINNILDYSKIESGKLELEESEFNLRALIEMVLDLTSSVNVRENVELIYHLEHDVPEYIIGDSTRLQQVLINLVTNGIKFTSQGDVYINVSLLEKDSERIRLQFKVKDTGIGIPANRMNRLFQSFSQVDASSTRKFGGTGLGLVISKKLVEAMDGDISVSSAPNKGSTFTFSINAGLSSRKKDALPSKILNKKKVFILDDNLTNLLVLKEQLELNSTHVDTFNDPKDILSSIDTLNTYDFGILDMQMPQFDGIKVASEIRKKWTQKDLPLVLLSSIHELENTEQRKMFDLYLTKPVKQTQLLNNLERIFIKGNKSKIIEASEENLVISSDTSILLVEDNLINQKVATKILERLGLKADIAQDGQHALDIIQSKEYDLVFMDMEMPVMDGLEATRNIKLIEKTLPKSPIIIAMTANALPGDRERCIEAGMDDFVSKPITVESVRLVLKKWLRDF